MYHQVFLYQIIFVVLGTENVSMLVLELLLNCSLLHLDAKLVHPPLISVSRRSQSVFLVDLKLELSCNKKLPCYYARCLCNFSTVQQCILSYKHMYILCDGGRLTPLLFIYLSNAFVMSTNTGIICLAVQHFSQAPKDSLI